MFSTTFLILVILLVTLLYLQFNASAFYITTWKYKRLTHWQAIDKRSILRKIYVSAERARLGKFPLYKYQKLLSFNVWVGTYTNNITVLGYFVTSVHSLQFPCYIIITHDMALQCVPEKTEPWNKGLLWPSSGVYDCSHTFIIKYDHYAFEWYIVQIPPVMQHWAALFSKLNVKIHLLHFMVGR